MGMAPPRRPNGHFHGSSSQKHHVQFDPGYLCLLEGHVTSIESIPQPAKLFELHSQNAGRMRRPMLGRWKVQTDEAEA